MPYDLSIPYQEGLLNPPSPLAQRFLRSYKDGHNYVVVSGPRNCAKTLLILWYLLHQHQRVPGLKSAVIRFEHKSISPTVLRTLRDKILRYPFEDDRNPFVLYGGENRPEHLRFENNGQMDFRGLDGKGKALGAEYDLIFVNQAEQETRSRVWGDISGTIVGGRAGNWIEHGRRCWQLIADANPSTPHHYLYQRKSEWEWLDFTHKENPLFYNWDTHTWSEQGRATVEALKEAYTGFDYARMVEGKWVAAEGMVYPQFRKELHVRDMQRDDFGSEATWYCGIDWGGKSLTAIGIYAVVDGTYYLFKEICRSQTMVSEMLAMLEAMCERHDIPGFEAVFVDHDAEHVLQCEDAGLPVQLADKSVLEGIETVRRVINDNRFIVNSMSLEDRDSKAVDVPQGFAEEVMAYAYREEGSRSYSIRDEHPVKVNDHSCDQVRYVLHTLEEGGYSYVPEPFVVRYE